MELLARGQAARQVAFTATNENSSRSHSIVTIKVQITADKSSELVIVDLAGSERTTRTKNTGARLKVAAGAASISATQRSQNAGLPTTLMKCQ